MTGALPPAVAGAPRGALVAPELRPVRASRPRRFGRLLPGEGGSLSAANRGLVEAWIGQRWRLFSPAGPYKCLVWIGSTIRATERVWSTGTIESRA